MAKNIKRHLSHLKSSGTTAPAASDLIYGEIAVGYKDGEERLYIKNSSDNIVTIGVPAGDILNCMVTDTSGDSAVSASINACSPTGRTVTVAHSTAAGYKHVPAGGSNGQFLGWNSAGTAKWVANPNTDSATTLNGHYAPTAISGGTKTAAATGGSALAWSSPIVTGVTLSGDAKGHITAVAVSSAKLPANPNTDTKVTAVENHYTPTSSATISKTASSTTSASWGSSDFVTGITLYKDAAGHITDMAVGSLQLPANPNTNTWRAVNVNGASKYTTATTATNVLSFTSGSTNGTIGVSGTDVKVTGFLPYETSLTSTSDEKLPTSKAVSDYVTQQMASALTYKGTAPTTLPTSPKVGDLYVVATAGTYAGQACEVGDYIICRTNDPVVWDVINGENQVENKSATLAEAGSSATLATVDGTNITVTTPSTWTGVAKTGTVTKVSTGAGLVGGDVTTTGTLKAALSSETTSTLAAVAMGSTSGRQYAVGLDKNGVLSVNIPWTNTNSEYVPTGRTITATSGLTGGGNLSANRTIGLATTGTAGTYGPTTDVTGTEGTTIKIPQITTDAYGRVTSVTERTLTNKNNTYTVNNGTFTISGNGTSVASTSANASTNSGLNIKNGTFVSLTTGTSELTIGVSTGTSSTTLARGDHSHSSYVNQNAYSNIKIGSTTLSAASTTDTVEFATTNTSGTDGLTISGTNGAAGADKVTINLGDIVCGDYA